jgi:hypothetical protein
MTAIIVLTSAKTPEAPHRRRGSRSPTDGPNDNTRVRLDPQAYPCLPARGVG